MVILIAYPNANGVTANDARINERFQPGEVEYSAREYCIDAASVEGEGTLREVRDRAARTGREGSSQVRDLKLMGVPDECFTACCELTGTIVKLCL